MSDEFNVEDFLRQQTKRKTRATEAALEAQADTIRVDNERLGAEKTLLENLKRRQTQITTAHEKISAWEAKNGATPETSGQQQSLQRQLTAIREQKQAVTKAIRRLRESGNLFKSSPLSPDIRQQVHTRTAAEIIKIIKATWKKNPEAKIALADLLATAAVEEKFFPHLAEEREYWGQLLALVQTEQNALTKQIETWKNKKIAPGIDLFPKNLVDYFQPYLLQKTSSPDFATVQRQQEIIQTDIKRIQKQQNHLDDLFAQYQATYQKQGLIAKLLRRPEVKTLAAGATMIKEMSRYNVPSIENLKAAGLTTIFAHDADPKSFYEKFKKYLQQTETDLKQCANIWKNQVVQPAQEINQHLTTLSAQQKQLSNLAEAIMPYFNQPPTALHNLDAELTDEDK